MKKSKKTKWIPPTGYEYYFRPESDEIFKAKHPVGYFFLVLLGITVLIMPGVLFCLLVGTESNWVLLGFIGGFIFGIGLFNFVAIIIEQYLGHLVSIVSFAVGGVIMLVSWLLCR